MSVPGEPDAGCGGRPKSKTALGSGSEPTVELGMQPNRTVAELKQAHVLETEPSRSVTKGSGFGPPQGPDMV